MGLWDKANAAVRLVEGGDGFPWSWRLVEVSKGMPGALQTVSAPELMKKHGLHGFDMVKLGTHVGALSGLKCIQDWVLFEPHDEQPCAHTSKYCTSSIKG